MKYRKKSKNFLWCDSSNMFCVTYCNRKFCWKSVVIRKSDKR